MSLLRGLGSSLKDLTVKGESEKRAVSDAENIAEIIVKKTRRTIAMVNWGL